MKEAPQTKTVSAPDNAQEIIERCVDRLDESKCLSSNLDFTKAGVIVNTAIQDATAALLAQRDTLQAQVSELLAAAKTLAMLALQSERYIQDADYRDATDNVLANAERSAQ